MMNSAATRRDIPLAASGPAVAARARLLRQLHDGPEVLILPNVWDAGSAALIGQLPGVKALATTSAGMAAALGRPDGEWLTLDELLAVVGQITRTVDLPVTVDLESGYGRRIADVTDSVTSLMELGAAGVNVEDGLPTDPRRLAPAEVHAERVAAIRAAGQAAGIPIVINARTDVYLREIGAPGDRFAEAVRRLRRYREAGADCLFLPGFPVPGTDREQAKNLIGALVEALDGVAVNLLTGPALPAIAELRVLGVRRVSVGSALYRLGMATVLDAAGALLARGDLDGLSGADALSYGRLAELLSDAPRP
jgi:2-methylisocitrate lyase-like PEP mutase family enzyme